MTLASASEAIAPLDVTFWANSRPAHAPAADTLLANAVAIAASAGLRVGEVAKSESFGEIELEVGCVCGVEGGKMVGSGGREPQLLENQWLFSGVIEHQNNEFHLHEVQFDLFGFYIHAYRVIECHGDGS